MKEKENQLIKEVHMEGETKNSHHWQTNHQKKTSTTPKLYPENSLVTGNST